LVILLQAAPAESDDINPDFTSLYPLSNDFFFINSKKAKKRE
jgi:hypothetical protein